MADDLFDDPGVAKSVDWDSLRGKLLLIYSHKVEYGIMTAEYGEKEAIRADMVVLDADGGPEEMRSTLVFPLVLQGQLRSNVGTGRPNLGRLGGGDKNSKSKEEKAWRLVPANDVDKQRARDYINKKPKDKFDDVPF